jgi:serine carboxypeptidase-like clade 1
MKMLQGYIAGNPMTDKKFDTDGKIKFFHGMGLISDELYEVMKIITQFLYSFI